MKLKRLLFLILILTALPAVGQRQTGTIGTDDLILLYNSHISVGIDGSITVIDELRFEFKEEDSDRTGVFFEIQLPVTTVLGKENRQASVEVISAERNGKKEEFETADKESFMRLFVGSKNEIIPAGIHNYKIIYRVRDGITYNRDFNQIVWRLLKTSLNYPIKKITADVTLPGSVDVTHIGIADRGDYESYVQEREIKEHQAWVSFDNKGLGLHPFSIVVRFSDGIHFAVPPRFSTEKIHHFHSDILIETSGDIIVTESYEIDVQNRSIKSGIIRTLPRKERYNGRKNAVNYEILSITRNGNNEPYKKEKFGDWLDIRIGDKDRILSKGIHHYQVKYRVANIMDLYEDFDEFYWNVNGNDWDFYIDKITAKVRFPEEASIISSSCYSGYYSSNRGDCREKQINDYEMEWSAIDMDKGMGLTIAAGIEKGIIAEPNAMSRNWPIYLLSPILLGFLIYCFVKWWRHGKDFPKKIIVPQYFPPNDLSPAALGYLNNEEMNTRLISASLVNLAVKGYIQIKETSPKTYKIHKLKNKPDELPPEEAELMNKLFADKTKELIEVIGPDFEYEGKEIDVTKIKADTVTIDGTYRSSVESAKNAFESSLKSRYKDIIEKGGNMEKIIPGLWVMIGIYVFVLFIIAFRQKDYGDIWPGLGHGALFVFAVFMLATNVNLVKIPKRKLSGKILEGIAILALILFMVLEVRYLTGSRFMAAGQWANLFLVLTAVVFIIFAYLIKQPREEKLQIQADINGFKRYINATEKQIVQFQNPPEMTPEVFDKFLPFAIAIKAEKIWGERFKIKLKESGTNYENQWFNEHSSRGFGNNLEAFTDISNKMSSSFTASSTRPAPPSTRSSSGSGGWSGSSGSRGGGYSGGGHGGGGGRGW